VDLILDTNSLSAIADGDAGAVAQFSAADGIGIPVIVLGEYRFGVSLSRHRVEYERWLAKMISVCGVLDITATTTVFYADLRVELKRAGTPIPSNDIRIAALCREHQSPLLSRDRHFEAVKGLRRVEW
jgi:tRNA(fMet)-specific endonuclease VapC